MKQLSNKEYEMPQQYQSCKLYGRVVTPDSLHLICAGLNNDPEKIGTHSFSFQDSVLACRCSCAYNRMWTHMRPQTIAKLRRIMPWEFYHP